MSSGRDINAVIDAICHVVSAIDQKWATKAAHIIDQLELLKTSAFYTAPESMSARWQDLALIISKELPPKPSNGWQVTVSGLCGGILDATYYTDVLGPFAFDAEWRASDSDSTDSTDSDAWESDAWESEDVQEPPNGTSVLDLLRENSPFEKRRRVHK